MTTTAPTHETTGPQPLLFLSHGAPPLADDPVWPGQLRDWAAALPRPRDVLVVSAHWEHAPVAVSATSGRVPLLYDFWGFPQHYYDVTYAAPGAPELARRVAGLLGGAGETLHQDPERGLDHGAYVPLVEMFPAADVPVLQLSLPTLDPRRLFDLGRRLAPLREEGTLVVGSGFTTHNLRWFSPREAADAPAPTPSREFDHWAAEAVGAGDVDAVLDTLGRAPAATEAHPRTEHWAPLHVVLGAAAEGGDASGRPRRPRVGTRPAAASWTASGTACPSGPGSSADRPAPRHTRREGGAAGWQHRGMADDRALLPPEVHLAELRAAVEALTRAASTSWMGAPVPTCPGWTLLDLVAHVGMAQEWAACALRGDHEGMADVELAADEGRAAADPLRWLADRTEHLVATLESVPDDVDALVFLKQAPPPRRFWARRQCHEAVVHALDAVAARQGRLLTAADAWFGPELALDGVDELLVGFWQRGRVGPRSDPPQRVLVRVTDAEAAWLLEVGPQRTVTRRLPGGGAPEGDRPADAEVTGAAVDLYLALWNRGGAVDDPAGLLPRWREETPIRWS